MGIVFIGGALLFRVDRHSGSVRPAAEAAEHPSTVAPRPAPLGNSAAVATPRSAGPVQGDTLEPTSAFEPFERWLLDFRRGVPSSIAEGVRLAHARRVALKELIRRDPERAVRLAVSEAVRRDLPPQVVAELERPVEAFGRLDVFGVCGEHEGTVERVVTVGAQRYHAYVFGARSGAVSKRRIAVHGVAVDEVLALNDRSYRQLDATERAARGLSLDGIAVAVGGTTRTFGSAEALDRWQADVWAADARPGVEISALDDAADTPAPANWVAGKKTVLWIRAEFPDAPGGLPSDSDITNSMAAVNAYYLDVSHGTTSFETTILPGSVPTVNRADALVSAAATTLIGDEALKQAKAYDAAHGGTGKYNPDNYDRWIVVFRNAPQFAWSGYGLIGAAGVWLNGAYSAGIVAHELGHNQGLMHSHSWQTDGTSPIGPGSTVEYGDPYDVMGDSGSLPQGHFNAVQKLTLGYLSEADIQTVTTTGTYRLYRHDSGAADGVQGLRIAVAPGCDYMVEYRRQVPPNLAYYQFQVTHGVFLHWAGYPSYVQARNGTYLLDLTPKTPYAFDAPLSLDGSFVDPEIGVTITVDGWGGAEPSQWTDVTVRFGATGNNHDPVLTATPPPTGPVAARSAVRMTAAATDPDGDPVAFRWDFGDGSPVETTPGVIHRWAKAGNYTLTCRVLDGKGGLARQSFGITVTDPLGAWTNETVAAGQIFMTDVAYGAGQFVAVTQNSTVLTSGDGVNWSVGGMQDSSAVSAGYNAIAYGGGAYVAVGVHYDSASRRWAGIEVSADGINWVGRSPASVGALNAIAYGAGRFVAVGESGAIVSSADALSWNSSRTGITAAFRAVRFANGQFVAAGDNGAVVVSADGVSWQDSSVTGGDSIFGVGYVDGTWILVGSSRAWKSSDGRAWQLAGVFTPIPFIQKVASIGELMSISTGLGQILVSADGITWTELESGVGGRNAGGVAEGNGVVVAGASGGTIYRAGTPRMVAPTFSDVLQGHGTAVTLKATARALAKTQLWVDGTLYSERLGVNPSLSWQASTWGAHLLKLRGVAADGTTSETVRQVVVGPDDWTWVAPSLRCPGLHHVAFANGRWYAAGDQGIVLTSRDGVVWETAMISGQAVIRAIATDGTRVVVAAGAFSDGFGAPTDRFYYTDDGQSWATVPTSDAPTTLRYAQGRWVGRSYGSTMVSADGVQWMRFTTGPNVGGAALAYGAGKWVTVGPGIGVSTDGKTWSGLSVSDADLLEGVAYGNGVWVAVGYAGRIKTSTDTATWAAASSGTSAALHAVEYIAGQFVAVGEQGVVLVSADGAKWTNVGTRAAALNAIATDGARTVAVGDGAEIQVGDQIANLKAVDTAPRLVASAARAEGDRLLVGSDGRDVTTGKPFGVVAAIGPDRTWVPATSTFSPKVLAIAHGPGGYVAAANSNQLLVSSDGTRWTPNLAAGFFTNGAAAGPKGFVVVGDGGGVATSPDGGTWTQRPSVVMSKLRAVTYGAAQFVAVGDGGVVLTSSDGATWVQRPTGITATLNSVTWAPVAGFVAVGENGTVLRSADGIVWSAANTGPYDYLPVVVGTPFGYLTFVANYSKAYVSGDGQTWWPIFVPTEPPAMLAADGNYVWLVGREGSILRAPLGRGPTLTSQPLEQAVATGQRLQLSASVAGTGTLTYQWFRNGIAIPGATSATYSVAAVNGGDAGTYVLKAADDSAKVVTSDDTVVTVDGAGADPSRLVNLSVRAALDPQQTFIVGFATTGSRNVLVRGVGPTLGDLGVTGAYADPKLELYSGAGAFLDANDNWSALLAPTFAKLGAFPLGSDSKDAALLVAVNGASSAQLKGSGSGTVLVEVYDVDGDPLGRLANLSARTNVRTGANVLVAGLVVRGSHSTRLLIRGIGPKLTAFGVSGVLSDPRIEVYDAAHALVAANDNWSATDPDAFALQAAFAATGAFGLDRGSKDAAMIVTLMPGLYTVQLSGNDSGTGDGLLEIYQLP